MSEQRAVMRLEPVLPANEQSRAAQLEQVWKEPPGFIGWFKAIHHTTIV